jgi:hypothetical protein
MPRARPPGTPARKTASVKYRRTNEKVYIIARESMEILTSFGDGGRQPGEFYAVHSIAADSKGNMFTTKTYRGQRIRKFLSKGLAAVTKKDQGSGLAEVVEELMLSDWSVGLTSFYGPPRLSLNRSAWRKRSRP